MKQENSSKPQPKKQAGVWIDHQHAVLIAAPEGQYTVQQSIETTAPAHSRHSEQAIHNAEQAITEKHFHSVAEHLAGYDEIFLFGQGTAQAEMKNHLNEDPRFRGKKIAIDRVDRLTQDQMVAKVRSFFDRVV